MLKCKQCKAPVDELAVFPGGICLACHAAKWDRVPLDQLPPPDFAAAVRPMRKRRGSP